MNFAISLTDNAARQLNRFDQGRKRFVLLTTQSALSDDPYAQSERTGLPAPRERILEATLLDAVVEHQFTIYFSVDAAHGLVEIIEITCSTHPLH